MSKLLRIKGIYLKNFQSIGEEGCFIRLDGISILVGPNSAGKSAVLDAIRAFSTINNRKHFTSLMFHYGGDLAELGLEFSLDLSRTSITWYEKDETHRLWSDELYNFSARKLYLKLERNLEELYVDDKLFYRRSKPETFVCWTDIVDSFVDRRLSKSIDNFNDSGQTDYNNWFDPLNFLLELNKDAALYEEMYCYELSSIVEGKFLDTAKTSILTSALHVVRETTVGLYYAQLLLLENLGTQPVRDTFGQISFNRDQNFNSVFSKEDEDEIWQVIANSNLSKRKKDRYYAEFVEGSYQETWVEFGKHSLEALQKVDQISRALTSLLSSELSSDFTHISGSRRVLDSTKPFACFGIHQRSKTRDYSYLTPSSHESDTDSDDTQRSLRRFCAFLEKHDFGSSSGSYYNYWDSHDKWKNLVDTSFSTYLPSLKGYSIEPLYLTTSIKARDEILDNAFRQVFLKVKNPSGKLLDFKDVGSGISYILPILTALSDAGVSYVEQPELHLHPKAQCELADVFIAGLTNASCSIVETHSEHFILRILRRIRETKRGHALPKKLKLANSDVRIYFFDPVNPKRNITRVKEIRLDEYGELLNSWPGGFFPEREEEILS